MEQHFVTFLGPVTFVPEETTRPIRSWDVDHAVAMAREIVERHDARPFGFRFTTRARSDTELDSHVISRSGIYYLGGTILTLDEIKARNDPNDRILISNMEGNGCERIVDNRNSWRWTAPLEKDDIVLTVTL